MMRCTQCKDLGAVVITPDQVLDACPACACLAEAEWQWRRAVPPAAAVPALRIMPGRKAA